MAQIRLLSCSVAALIWWRLFLEEMEGIFHDTGVVTPYLYRHYYHINKSIEYTVDNQSYLLLAFGNQLKGLVAEHLRRKRTQIYR